MSIAIKRTCLACEHLDIAFGEYGYSEMTPGSSPTIECDKGKFDSYTGDFYSDRMVERAKACNAFEVSKELADESAS